MIGERLDKAFLELEAQVSRVSGKEYYALYARSFTSLTLFQNMEMSRCLVDKVSSSVKR